MTHWLAMAAAAMLVIQAVAYGVLIARDHRAGWSAHLWAAGMMVASVAGARVLLALY